MLKYETEPLAEAVEIAGPVVAELAVSTDAEDTDFTVKLVDVYPNGYEALVLDQAFRLRFREGFEQDGPRREGQGLSDQGEPVVDGARVQQGPQDRDPRQQQQLARVSSPTRTPGSRWPATTRR